MSGILIDVNTRSASAQKDLAQINKQLVQMAKQSADSGKSLGKVDQAKFNGVSRSLREATSNFARFKSDGSKSIKTVNSDAQTLTKTIGQVKNAVVALGTSFLALQGVNVFNKTADQLTRVENQLKLVVKDMDNLLIKQTQLFHISQRTYTAYEDTAYVFQNMSVALKNFDDRRILKVTETLQKMATLSGGSVESMKAAFLQLNQGLSSGTLRGEELNSVLEQFKYFGKELREGLDMNAGSLRKFAEEGKLTTQIVVDVIENAAEKVNKDFASIGLTAEVAFDKAKSAASNFFGSLNRSIGFSKGFASRFSGIADSLDDLTTSMLSNIQLLRTGVANYITQFDLFTADQLAFKAAMALEITPGEIYSTYRAYKRQADFIARTREYIGKLTGQAPAKKESIFDSFLGTKKDIEATAKENTEALKNLKYDPEQYKELKKSGAFADTFKDTFKDLASIVISSFESVRITFINIAKIFPVVLAPVVSVFDSISRQIEIFKADVNATVYDALIPFIRGIEAVNQLINFGIKGNNIERAWVNLFKSDSVSEFAENFRKLNEEREKGRENDFARGFRDVYTTLAKGAYAVENFAISIGLLDNKLLRIRRFRFDRLVIQAKLFGSVISRIYKDVFATTLEPIITRITTMVQLMAETLWSALTDFLSEDVGKQIGKSISNGIATASKAFESFVIDVLNGDFSIKFTTDTSALESIQNKLIELGKAIIAFVKGLAAGLFENIYDSFKTSAVSQVNGVFKDIRKAYDKFIFENSPGWTLIYPDEVLRTVRDTFKSIKIAYNKFVFEDAPSWTIIRVDDVQETFKRAIGWLKKQIRQEVGQFKDLFSGNFSFSFGDLKGPIVKDRIKQEIEEFKKFFSGDFSVSFGIDKVQSQIQVLIDMFKGIAESADSFLSRAGKTVGVFTNYVKELFYDVWDAVVGHSYWPDTIDGVVAYANNLQPAETRVQKFAQIIQNTFDTIKNHVLASGNTVGDVGSKLAESFANVDWANIGQTLISNIGAIFFAAFQFLEGGFFSKLFSISFFVSLFGDSFKSAVELLTGELASTAGQIAQTFVEHVAAGFFQGLKTLTDAVPNILRGFFRDLGPLWNVFGQALGLVFESSILSTLAVAFATYFAFTKDRLKQLKKLMQTVGVIGTKGVGGAKGSQGLIDLVPINASGAIAGALFATAFLDQVSVLEAAAFGIPFLVHSIFGTSAAKRLAGEAFAQIKKALAYVYAMSAVANQTLAAKYSAVAGIQNFISSLFSKSGTKSKLSEVAAELSTNIVNMFKNIKSNAEKYGAGKISLSSMLFSSNGLEIGTGGRQNVFLGKAFRDFWDEITNVIGLNIPTGKLKATAKTAYDAFSGAIMGFFGSGGLGGVVIDYASAIFRGIATATGESFKLMTDGVRLLFGVLSSKTVIFAAIAGGALLFSNMASAASDMGSAVEIASDNLLSIGKSLLFAASAMAVFGVAYRAIKVFKAARFAAIADELKTVSDAIIGTAGDRIAKKVEGGMSKRQARAQAHAEIASEIEVSRRELLKLRRAWIAGFDAVKAYALHVVRTVSGYIVQAFSLAFGAISTVLLGAFALIQKLFSKQFYVSLAAGFVTAFKTAGAAFTTYFANVLAAFQTKGVIAGIAASFTSLGVFIPKLGTALKGTSKAFKATSAGIAGIAAGIGRGLMAVAGAIGGAILPLLGTVTAWALGIGAAGVLAVGFFGPGETFFSNLEWAYDKIRAIIGLKPESQLGRFGSIFGKLPTGAIDGIQVDFQGILGNIDLKSLTNAEYARLEKVVDETSTTIENLKTAELKQGKLTFDQRAELISALNGAKDVFARLPQMEPSSEDGLNPGYTAQREAIGVVDKSFRSALKNALGFGSIRSKSETPFDLQEQIDKYNNDELVATYTENASLIAKILEKTVGFFRGIGDTISNVGSSIGDFSNTLAKPINYINDQAKAAGEASRKFFVDLYNNFIEANSEKFDKQQLKSFRDLDNFQKTAAKYGDQLREDERARLNKLEENLRFSRTNLETLEGRKYQATQDLSQRDYDRKVAEASQEVIDATNELSKAYVDFADVIERRGRTIEFRKGLDSLASEAKQLFGIDFGTNNRDFFGDSFDLNRIEGLLRGSGSEFSNDKGAIELQRLIDEETFSADVRRKLQTALEKKKIKLQFILDTSKTDLFFNSYRERLYNLLNPVGITADTFKNMELNSSLLADMDMLGDLMNDLSAADTQAEFDRISKNIEDLRKKILQRLPDSNLFKDINALASSAGASELGKEVFAAASFADIDNYRKKLKEASQSLLALHNIKLSDPGSFIEQQKVLKNYLSQLDEADIANKKLISNALSDAVIGTGSVHKAAKDISKLLGVTIPEGLSESTSELEKWVNLTIKATDLQLKLAEAIRKGNDTRAADLAKRITEVQLELSKLSETTDLATFIGRISEAGTELSNASYLKLDDSVKESLKAKYKELKGIDTQLRKDISKISDQETIAALKRQATLYGEIRDELKTTLYDNQSKVQEALSRSGVSDPALIRKLSSDQLKAILAFDESINNAQINMANTASEGLDASAEEAVRAFARTQANLARFVARAARTFKDKFTLGRDLFNIQLDDRAISKLPAKIRDYIASAGTAYSDAIENINDGLAADSEGFRDSLQDTIDTLSFLNFFDTLRSNFEMAATEGYKTAFERINGVVNDLPFDDRIFAKFSKAQRSDFSSQATALQGILDALNLNDLPAELEAILTQVSDITLDPADVLSEFKQAYEAAFPDKKLAESPIQGNTDALYAVEAALRDFEFGVKGESKEEKTERKREPETPSAGNLGDAVQTIYDRLAKLREDLVNQAVSLSDKRDAAGTLSNFTGFSIDPDIIDRATSEQFDTIGRKLAELADIDVAKARAIRKGASQDLISNLQIQRELAVSALEDFIKGLTRISEMAKAAGESLATTVRDATNEAFLKLIKGEESSIKETILSVLDAFANRVLETFVNGLLDPIVGEDSFIFNKLKDFGSNLLKGAIGIFGGEKKEGEGTENSQDTASPVAAALDALMVPPELRQRPVGGVPGGSPVGDALMVPPELRQRPVGGVPGGSPVGDACNLCAVGSQIADPINMVNNAIVEGNAQRESLFSTLGNTFIKGLTSLSDLFFGMFKPLFGMFTNVESSGGSWFGTIATAAVGGLTKGFGGSNLTDGFSSWMGSSSGSLSGHIGAASDVASLLNSKDLFGFANGGEIFGPGTGRSDSILARVSNGEYIVNAKQTGIHKPLLELINSGKLSKFADGGIVGVTPSGASDTLVKLSENKKTTTEQVFNFNVTGDISRQTRREIFSMIPQITNGVNKQNHESGYRR